MPFDGSGFGYLEHIFDTTTKRQKGNNSSEKQTTSPPFYFSSPSTSFSTYSPSVLFIGGVPRVTFDDDLNNNGGNGGVFKKRKRQGDRNWKEENLGLMSIIFRVKIR